MRYDPDKAVAEVMGGLKNFQRATVERIDELFRQGANRVLVADEVGLGKTLVAKGVIVKTAKLRREEKDRLLKVVYICSNQGIAAQNIQRLRIDAKTKIDDLTYARLSMEHLLAAEQEIEMAAGDCFIQLIPLTPGTSFSIGSGTGSAAERALIYLLLKNETPFKSRGPQFEQLMISGASVSWRGTKEYIKERVDQCRKKSRGKYPESVLKAVRDEIGRDAELHANIESYFSEPLENRRCGALVINKLRRIFASVSVSMLDPDLVILDEFQRFKEMLENRQPEDMQMLVDRFFKSSDKLRVLMLSATPFKLYATAEDISESNCDEAYEGFYKVIRFLAGEEGFSAFSAKWQDYYRRLRSFRGEEISDVCTVKDRAEAALYQWLCRTERNSVKQALLGEGTAGDTEKLTVEPCDIESAAALGRLLREIGQGSLNCIEFSKSSPYLLSFMQNYKLKKQIEAFFMKSPDKLKDADNKYLWIKRASADKYRALPAQNARLSALKDKVFEHKAALLLWVPPSMPYYGLQGPFKGSEGFSKFLAFSCWEMVPRMISALLSYEAEYLTIGKLFNKLSDKDQKGVHGFADEKKRFPLPRLRFGAASDEGRGMNLLCLLYPSAWLSNIWNVRESLNKSESLKEIEKKLSASIKKALNELKPHQNGSGRVDDRWYYMVPMLIDGVGYISEWADALSKQEGRDGHGTGTGQESMAFEDPKGFAKQIKALCRFVAELASHKSTLGRMPADLLQTLVNMALASPAVCIHRRAKCEPFAAGRLARRFIDRLNTPESTAVIDLAYGRKKDDSAHWQNVLQYCKDGNFQAMFDEYFHMVGEEFGPGPVGLERDSKILSSMEETIRFRSASYEIDTFNSFAGQIKGQKQNRARMRTHFAVCFNNDTSENRNSEKRKNAIRAAFNSPLRPFVLATTSIGQEGLDFHYYCRKVVHWNLPSNPIDLEQREGRVKRYKCLAVRQSLVQKYGGVKFRSADFWNEMFLAACSGRAEKGASELAPFWSLGDDQSVHVERIPLLYPLSRDQINYEKLVRMLSLYRVALGQPNQEALIENLLRKVDSEEELRRLFMNLSPFERSKRR